MLAVQHGRVALGIVLFKGGAELLLRGEFGLGRYGRLPRSITDPRALFLACVLDVEEAQHLAVLLKLILNLARQPQRLRPGQVDAAVLQFAVGEDGHRHQPAGFGMPDLASPLKDGNGAQIGGVFGGFCQLPWVLRGDWMGSEERHRHGNRRT
jgi:hypothetical protein